MSFRTKTLLILGAVATVCSPALAATPSSDTGVAATGGPHGLTALALYGGLAAIVVGGVLIATDSKSN